jgi:hypothetical protein
MFCGQCGKNLPDDVRFCQSCGRPTAPTPISASFTNAAAAVAPALSTSVEDLTEDAKNALAEEMRRQGLGANDLAPQPLKKGQKWLGIPPILWAVMLGVLLGILRATSGEKQAIAPPHATTLDASKMQLRALTDDEAAPSAEQRLMAFEKHFDAENDRLDKEMSAVSLSDGAFESRLPSLLEAATMHRALTTYCEGTKALENEQAAFLASEHIALAPVAVSQHHAALNSCDAGIALWAFLATPATPSERSHLGPWRDNYVEKLTAYRDAANAQKKVDADFDADKVKGNR